MTDMDIEFIKWMCEQAGDEWVFYDDGVSHVPKDEENNIYAIYIKDGQITGGLAHYKYLLQKTIDCITEKCDGRSGYNIYQSWFGVFVYDCYGDVQNGAHGNTERDKARETALKYIYEQETKEQND